MKLKNAHTMRLNAKQLRKIPSAKGKRKSFQSKVKRNEIYLILDKVLDTYNVGSCFRLADAVAAKRVYLCSGTETPPNHKIKKASINTTEIVDWEYHESTQEAIRNLRDEVPEIQVIAVEQIEGSIPYSDFEYKFPLALIVGNESTGVSKEVLEVVDGVVELPMFGINVSLNVIVSLSIVVYKAIENCKLKIGN